MADDAQHVSKHMKEPDPERTAVRSPSPAGPGQTAPHQPLQAAVGYKPLTPYVPQQVNMPDRKPRKHHPIRNLFILLLVCILVLAGFAAESLMRISATAGSAEALATELQSEASAGDLSGARTALASLMEDMDTLKAETDEWIWTVLGYIPYIGDDVTAAKTMVSAMDRVSTDALQPVLEQYDSITSSAATVQEKADASSSLATALKSAQTTIEGAQSELSSMPAPHFPELQDLASRLESSLGAVDSQVATINAATSSVSDAATLLFSALAEAGLA